MNSRRVQTLHDKHRNQVIVTVHDDTVSLSACLTPQEATEIGRVGEMAMAYEIDPKATK